MADDEEITDEKDMADEDSTNPHIADPKSEMSNQEEQNGTLSTPTIETRSEILEVEMTQISIENGSPDPQVMGDSLMPQETDDNEKENKHEKEKEMEKVKDKCKPPGQGVLRSPCRPRSRDPRRCQKHFREMIGKHEIKNEELEKKEGDLRQRLEMLECSMPAVMVWNIWRMSQGAPVPSLRRVLEKQFQGFASGGLPCPSTPSQHYDCRVREVEAERKQAQRRADEARALWAEKEFALEEQKRKLEEARRTQALHKERIEKLTNQVKELKKAKESEGESCQTGECGEIRCKQMWLGDVASTTSVKSTDLECLARLQELAEAELCMKRHITELERREETYMRTLQQADVLWSKMEGDAASTMNNLQEQLDLKIAANQQLAYKVCCLEDTIEKLNSKLANCKNELGKVIGVDRVDAIIGSDDDHATVANKDCLAKMQAGMVDEGTMPENVGTLSHATEQLDQDSSFNSDEDGVTCGSNEICAGFDEDEVICGSDKICAGLDEDGVICGSDAICAGFDKDEDSDSEGEPCGSDFVCNDQVFSPAGMEDADTVAESRVLRDERDGRDQIMVPRVELRSWKDITTGVQQTITICPDCSSMKDDVDNLSKSIASYLREGEDIPSQKNIMASPEMQETEIEREEEIEGKLETEDVERESDEEYQMAVENLTETTRPPQEWEESKKMQEEGEPTVIGELSSKERVQDIKAVERRTKKEIAEIDGVEGDQVSEEKETMANEEKQIEEIIEEKEEKQKIRDEQDPKAEEREGIVHIIPKEEKTGTKLEIISDKDKLSDKALIPEKKRLVEREGEERLTFTSDEHELEEKKKMKESRDDKQVPTEKEGEEIVHKIPKKEKEEAKLEVISEQDELSSKAVIPGKERPAKRESEERLPVTSEGKEIMDIIPKEEKRLSVRSAKDQEKQITDEELVLKTKPILTISEEGAENLPAEELETEKKVSMTKGEEKKLKEEKKVSITEGEEILPSEKLKEEKKVSITEGEEILPSEKLKEEKQVSIGKGEEILPAEKMKEKISITEGEEILHAKELKKEEKVSMAEGAEILPAEELEEGEGIAEDVEMEEIEKETMPTIPEVKEVCEPTAEDFVPVLDEIPEEKKESEEDFSCICQTEEEPKVEKEILKQVSEEDVEISERSICICKEKDVSRDGKSRRKLLIIRKTISRRPDEIKVHLERDEFRKKGRQTKMTYIKVKDESIGTVVSVGLQTQEEFQNNGKSEEAQSVGTDSTMSCLCTGRSAKKEKVQEKFKGPIDQCSESRCFMCKKELSSRDDVFVINDSKSASSSKVTDSKTEINMVCFTCQRKQASKSKIQSKSKCSNCEEPKKFPRPRSSVTVGKSSICSHNNFEKKMTKISQEKRDQGCLAKISRSNKVDYKERKKKSESEPNVKNRKRLLENQSKHASEGSVVSQTDTCQILTEPSSSCTCITDKTSSLNRKKVKEEEICSCHCSDTD